MNREEHIKQLYDIADNLVDDIGKTKKWDDEYKDGLKSMCKTCLLFGFQGGEIQGSLGKLSLEQFNEILKKEQEKCTIQS